MVHIHPGTIIRNPLFFETLKFLNFWGISETLTSFLSVCVGPSFAVVLSVCVGPSFAVVLKVAGNVFQGLGVDLAVLLRLGPRIFLSEWSPRVFSSRVGPTS